MCPHDRGHLKQQNFNFYHLENGIISTQYLYLWWKWILLFIVSANFLSWLFSFVLCNFRLSTSWARVISHRSSVQPRCREDPMGHFGVCLFSLNQFFLRKSLSGLNKLMFVKNLEQSMAVLNINTQKMSICWKKKILGSTPTPPEEAWVPLSSQMTLSNCYPNCHLLWLLCPWANGQTALIKSFPALSVGKGLTSRYPGSLALASTHLPPSWVKLWPLRLHQVQRAFQR